MKYLFIIFVITILNTVIVFAAVEKINYTPAELPCYEYCNPQFNSILKGMDTDMVEVPYISCPKVVVYQKAIMVLAVIDDKLSFKQKNVANFTRGAIYLNITSGVNLEKVSEQKLKQVKNEIDTLLGRNKYHMFAYYYSKVRNYNEYDYEKMGYVYFYITTDINGIQKDLREFALKKLGVTLINKYELLKNHPTKETLLKLLNDQDPQIRAAAAIIVIKQYLNYRNDKEKGFIGIKPSQKLLVAISKFRNDNSVTVRVILASHGYFAKFYFKDKDWRVRKAVAESGKYLQILKNDKSIEVANEARRQLNLPLINSTEGNDKRPVAEKKRNHGMNDDTPQSNNTSHTRDTSIIIVSNDLQQSVIRARGDIQYKNGKLREVWGGRYGDWIDLTVMNNVLQESVIRGRGHIQYKNGKLREVWGGRYGDWIDLTVMNNVLQESVIRGRGHIQYKNGKLREAWGHSYGDWITIRNNTNMCADNGTEKNKINNKRPIAAKEDSFRRQKEKQETNSMGHEITIIEASYGAGENWIDVKEQLKKHAKNGVIKIMINNPNMGGDPAYRVDKILKLKYKYMGKTFKYWYPEGFTFRIPYEKHPRKIKITIRTGRGSYSGTKSMNIDSAINGSRKHVRLCTKKRFPRGSVNSFTISTQGRRRKITFWELSVAGHDAWDIDWIIFELSCGRMWYFSGSPMPLSSHKKDVRLFRAQTSIDFIFSGLKQGTIRADNPYGYKKDYPWVKKVKGIKFN
ncbi:MAG: hypothetical protein L3J71_07250 [Victivallaceae bacterium]|nr:hypothetical protein [Victivallaceae bacterium]